jgi:hypothetical protein
MQLGVCEFSSGLNIPAGRDLFATQGGLAGADVAHGPSATRKAWIPVTNAGKTTCENSRRLRSRGWAWWGIHVKPSVNRWSRITSSGGASSGFWSRLALAGALTAALGLAACGRKGPLDPPPSASLPETPGSYTARPGLGEQSYGAPASFLSPPPPAEPAPAAAPAPPAAPAAPAAVPPPQQKTFFLDFLLGK